MIQVGFQSLGSHALEMLPGGRLRHRCQWSGSAPSEPGREPSAIGVGRRGPGAGACTAGPVVDGVVTIPLATRWPPRSAVVGCRQLDDVDVGRDRPITAPTPSTATTRRWSEFAPPGSRGDLRPHLVRASSAGARGSRRGCPRPGHVRLHRRPDRRSSHASGQTQTEIIGRGRICSRTCWRTGGMDRRCWYPSSSTGRVHAGVRRRSSTLTSPLESTLEHIRWEGEGQARRALVEDIESWLRRPSRRAERSPNWARPGPTENETVSSSGPRSPESRSRATYRRARPYLRRPVRARFCIPCERWPGSCVTARHPADHDWHLGVGHGGTHVNGTSFWGGRTYVHGEGYCAARQPRRNRRRGTRVRADGFTAAAELASGTLRLGPSSGSSGRSAGLP